MTSNTKYKTARNIDLIKLFDSSNKQAVKEVRHRISLLNRVIEGRRLRERNNFNFQRDRINCCFLSIFNNLLLLD